MVAFLQDLHHWRGCGRISRTDKLNFLSVCSLLPFTGIHDGSRLTLSGIGTINGKGPSLRFQQYFFLFPRPLVTFLYMDTADGKDTCRGNVQIFSSVSTKVGILSEKELRVSILKVA